MLPYSSAYFNYTTILLSTALKIKYVRLYVCLFVVYSSEIC